MNKVLILDLDDTLFDTSALEPIRKAGKWRDINKWLPLCTVHEDVLDVLETARASGIKVAIFSDSPSQYIRQLLHHFDISVDLVVGYHDVRQHKPYPEGVQKILGHFSVEAHSALYLGDSDIDCQSAKNAGVEFFKVDWGTAHEVDSAHTGVSSLSEIVGAHVANLEAAQLRSGLLTDANKMFLGYYLDGVKQEIWSFKDGLSSSIDRWISKALEVSQSFPDVDYVIRALGHKELTTGNSNKPLDLLADNLAKNLSGKYIPEILTKSRVLEKSTRISASQRSSQVNGVYEVTYQERIARIECPTFLIVDDVHTSGATTDEIRRAVLQTYPTAQVFIFTLVKTLFRKDAKKASAELQHNNQLYGNLFSPARNPSARIDTASKKSRILGSKLVTKKFTANYTNTNHNFVIQNLPAYSISCESASTTLHSSILILKNILQRGKPTIASKRLRAAFGLEPHESGLDFEPKALISDAHLHWARLIRGDQKGSNFPAKYFFEELMGRYLGEYAFIKQLTVPEVQIFDMTQVYVEQFQNRQVDFYIPQVGVIIEIDGPQHRKTTKTDTDRDQFTSGLGLRTFRFSTAEISTENEVFVEKMEELKLHISLVDNLEQRGFISPPNHITLQHYAREYQDQEPLRTDKSAQLTASCRFQQLLLELIDRGVLQIGRETEIIFLNRDGIQFVHEAVEDLSEQLDHILCLQGVYDKHLKLDITEVDALPKHRDGSSIIIDFSIRERFCDQHQIDQDIIFVRTDYFDFYRSFSSGDASRIETATLKDYDHFQIACSQPISYGLDLSPTSNQRASLRYFLQNIFLPFTEDADFREGQIGIIGSALSRRSTIGLLPTGSGKSVCYQLASVLQPAVSFVVCPIKSLMYDQKAELDIVGFDRANYITSDQTPQEKQGVQREFGRGKYFFVFVSPERFQTTTFRQEISAVGLDLYFSYAVIDEAHCLSEWGHDFRTSYLNLANTIEKFAPNARYIGLTATASVNVLKDIQAEFSIEDECIRTPLNFTRDELGFEVIDDKGEKEDSLIQLVSKMEKKWNNSRVSSEKAGIVFTSTVNGKKGCHSLASRLANTLDMDVRYFSGSEPKHANFQGGSYDEYKREVQNDFKANKYRLLVATKAFGMGVNKGNISYTIHYGVPNSMEALYQEAGRAGRDKRLFNETPADCCVLLTRETSDQVLDKLWDKRTSIENLKDHRKQLRHESDLATNMFLLTESLDTIKYEADLLTIIYRTLIENAELRKITLDARNFKVDKSKFEKAIYRLSQIGIISDWVIDNFHTGVITVFFSCPNVEQIEQNLVATIQKYDPYFRLQTIFESSNKHYQIMCERLKQGRIDRTKFLFAILLIWSYDHFVYNRRQSQKNVYEQCVQVAGQGPEERAKFKEQLEAYFRHDRSTQQLLHLVEDSKNIDTWLSVFFQPETDEGKKKLISESQLRALSAQISRFLESYKDNPCLDFLSGLTRLTADQFDDADGETRMNSALDKIIALDKQQARALALETCSIGSLLSKAAKSRLARVLDKKFDDQSLLIEINNKLKDAYSYHTLMSPLVERLEQITSKQRGIQW